jgi:hypothetical protein
VVASTGEIQGKKRERSIITVATVRRRKDSVAMRRDGEIVEGAPEAREKRMIGTE